VPCRRQPALVRVEHVQPGERVSVERLHAHFELAVIAEGHAVPGIEFLLVDLGNVVEDDEDPLRGVLDNCCERPVPADVVPAESQTPAFQPPGSPLRGIRAACRHLCGIHVAAVGGV